MYDYDVVIAGGGLGGLTCASILGREGLKVCVLEKNASVGGCMQTFKRNGVIIDTGMHYVGSLDEGRILNRYLRFLGIYDNLKLKRLNSDGYDIVNINDKEYPLAIGRRNFVETLSEYFPDERNNIAKIISEYEKIGDLISVDNLQKSKSLSGNALKYFGISGTRFLESNTSDKILRRVLSGSGLCGGNPESVSLYVIATITDSFMQGAYRFVGGSSQVTDLLADTVKKHGGRIFTGSEVTRFVVENNAICGTEVNGIGRITGKYYISGIHPGRTLELTDKCGAIKKAYVSRIDSLKDSYGFFTVSAVLKPASFGYFNNNRYYSKPGDEENNILFCASPPSDSEFAEVVHILQPAYSDEFGAWNDTGTGQRGNEYKEFKQKKAEELIDYIDKMHPGLKKSVVNYYTSTPLTYRDYTATRNGSAYGIIKDFHRPEACLHPVRYRIPNLYFTGQNLNVHGMLGTVQTAMITCAELLGEKYLIDKILRLS